MPQETSLYKKLKLQLDRFQNEQDVNDDNDCNHNR